MYIVCTTAAALFTFVALTMNTRCDARDDAVLEQVTTTDDVAVAKLVREKWSFESFVTVPHSEYCAGLQVQYLEKAVHQSGWAPNALSRATTIAVAIHLQNGRTKFVRPAAANAANVRIVQVSPFDSSCFAVTAIIERPDKPNDSSNSEGAVWMWNPDDNTLQRIGCHLPLVDLHWSISGGRVALRWPIHDRREWKGTVSMRSSDEDNYTEWRASNSAFEAARRGYRKSGSINWNGSADVFWELNEQFAPSADCWSFLSLLRFPAQAKGVELRCYQITSEAKCVWRRSQEELERAVGTAVETGTIVKGAWRPDNAVFALFDSPSGEATLVGVETRSGNLRVLAKYKRVPDHIMSSFDTRFIAEATLNEASAMYLTISDARTGVEVVRRSLDSYELGVSKAEAKTPSVPMTIPVSFDLRNNLVLLSDKSVWILQYPYDRKARRVYGL